MKLIKIIVILIFIGILIIFGINEYIKISTKDKIIMERDIAEDFNVALVLGAGLKNGKPSPVLKDRLDTALMLYKNNKVSKIIVSGDHGNKNYDEVNVMKNYLKNEGVLSEDIFMDHAGFSTYDSIYRLREIFNVKKVIIVTQKYHLYRSLYIAKKLEIDAEGISATKRHYAGELKFVLREVIARDKDFVKTIFKPKSKYLGDAISVFGNGDITNDK